MRKNKFLRALTVEDSPVEDSPVSGQSVLRSGSINISQAVRALTNVVRTKDHPGFKMDVDMHNSEDFITRIGRSVGAKLDSITTYGLLVTFTVYISVEMVTLFVMGGFNINSKDAEVTTIVDRVPALNATELGLL